MATKITTSPTSKIFYVVSALAMLALGIYNWAISPQTSYLKAATQHNVLSARLDKKMTLIAGRKDKKNLELEHLKTQLAQIESTMFMPEEAEAFFADLEGTMASHGCKIQSLIFLHGGKSSTNTKNNIDPIAADKAAEVTFISGYAGIIKVLQEIASTEKKIDISNLRVESKKVGSSSLTCNMTVKIYVSTKPLISKENLK